MAKQKPEDQRDDVTFHGQSIDPEIQKKVDQYMDIDLDTPEPAESTASAEPAAAPSIPDASDAPEASSAPLLPTDQLPDSLKEKPKSSAKSIAVKDESEKEVPTAPELDGSAADVPAEPISGETPVETEEAASPEPEVAAAIDAESLAAPDFDENLDYEGKTIADMEKAVLPLDDPETSQAIDEIIAADSDKLLDLDDPKKESEPAAAVPVKKAKKEKRGNFLKTWFKTPLYRNATILVALIGVIAAGAIPASRYYLLNAAGVKVSTSLRVLDESTELPLKNVELIVAGKSAKSDSDGNVKLEGVPLGYQKLTIKKPAFAEINRNVTLGWGSNPLGDFQLTPVGSQYVFKLTDFLSGKPVTSGEIIYEESSAKISDKGEAKITVPNVKEEVIEIEITAVNYRTEKVKVNTTTEEEYSVQMVPSAKHIFFSKRSGKADLYKSDVDGKNQGILLSGTGIERDDSLGIAPHPSKNMTAFSSSRENVRNRDGYLLNTLQLINIETSEVTKVAQSERIQIINWVGDRLVYVKIAQGASQADPKRHRLMSYDIGSKTETELASTNYFNDVLSVNGAIYYSPALYKVNGSVGLYKINPDGSNKKTVFQKEVWNLFRTSYDKVSLSVGQDWYELNLANDSMAKVGGAPPVLKSRIYVKSPDGKRSVWIDERDGKTVLISYDHDSKKDKALVTQSGIKNPIRWLDDDHVVYRIANGQETADFVISLSGGEPKKIVDVMNSYGIDRWYYF